jgi:hypothetical protein
MVNIYPQLDGRGVMSIGVNISPALDRGDFYFVDESFDDVEVWGRLGRTIQNSTVKYFDLIGIVGMEGINGRRILCRSKTQ